MGGGGSSGSASAVKSATQTQLHKMAPARHEHGHDQIEPEDYVPKSFDFPDSDDEGGESAPAAGGVAAEAAHERGLADAGVAEHEHLELALRVGFFLACVDAECVRVLGSGLGRPAARDASHEAGGERHQIHRSNDRVYARAPPGCACAQARAWRAQSNMAGDGGRTSKSSMALLLLLRQQTQGCRLNAQSSRLR